MGPELLISEELHAQKYRAKGESFEAAMTRIAKTLSDDEKHYNNFVNILADMKFIPAGRVQSAVGSARSVTAFNCFVSMTIPDSMEGIMDAAKQAALTMRMGGGIGYDFSSIRPAGDQIKTMDTYASGPISFMNIFDAICSTVASAGHRRGAQMGVLRVDHPDIEAFIDAKRNANSLTQFNISVGITDEFMHAVENDGLFELKWGGTTYRLVRARELWDKIMESTWDWAEPGVLFMDSINRMNNLRYCETIAATNPCAEQPLPPHGACLLGSFNLVKYVTEEKKFDYDSFVKDIKEVVRAMDNIVDVSKYPLPQQQQEAKNKRRMGIGVTGAANAIEYLGYSYGSEKFVETLDSILDVLTNTCYMTSAELANEKGAFPLYDAEKYLQGEFVKRLNADVIEAIKKYGIRNSHLTSIAPTGTISLTANNISSGIEPVYSVVSERTINTANGKIKTIISDYGYQYLGVVPKTTEDCTIDDHLAVLAVSAKWMDSAVSKTLNVGANVTFEEFKDIYVRAFKAGAKGCTTFRAAGKRYGILNAAPVSEENETNETAETNEKTGGACFIDPSTGSKTCE